MARWTAATHPASDQPTRLGIRGAVCRVEQHREGKREQAHDPGPVLGVFAGDVTDPAKLIGVVREEEEYDSPDRKDEGRYAEPGHALSPGSLGQCFDCPGTVLGPPNVLAMRWSGGVGNRAG